jgi:small-conductance mechanosensitive channel
MLVWLLVFPGVAQAAAPKETGERRAAAVSVSPPPDAAIQRRIAGILEALGGVEDLEVEVRNGVVRLGGQARSLDARDRATDLAGRVEGVVLVRNEFHVASDVRGRLGPTWVKVKEYLARTLGFLPVLGVALAAFMAFALLSTWVGRWERPFLRIGLTTLGANIVRVLLRVLLLVAGLVVALDILGLIAFVGTVVGALSLLGVVAGIAFRDVVANYLPGILLGLNPPFGPGDDVRIGQHVGRVVRVTSRETILVTYDGQHLRIPNVRLIQEPITNFERYRERRLHFTLDLALSAELRRVAEVGREALLREPGILPEPRPFLRVQTVEAELVRVAFYAWADQRAASFHELESRARQTVKEALLAAKVPFPVRELAIHVPGAELVPAEEREEADDTEEALLDAHVREEQAASGGRDLLREGRSHASSRGMGGGLE